MPIQLSDINWGKYGGFEGPFFRGVIGYKLPITPSFLDKCMQVVTATEGGHYDACNFYDSMVCSLGIIQWAERGQYSVSSMLGKVAEACGAGYVIGVLGPALAQSQSTFEKNSQGQWRFKFTDDRGWVDTAEKQKQLFLSGSGLVGSWTPEQKTYAKQWAVCLANIWSNPTAQHVQLEFTQSRLLEFVMKETKAILFNDDMVSTDKNLVEAMRAAFISFAANNPMIASKSFTTAHKSSSFAMWSPGWVNDVLKSMTFSSKIGIYPARYKAISPVIKQLFGVQFPTIEVLTAWTGSATAVIAEDDPTPVTKIIPPPPMPIQPDPAPEPTPTPIVVVRSGFWASFIAFIQFLISAFTGKKS